MNDEPLGDWYTGYAVTAIVILLVVALVAGILLYLRRIGVSSVRINEELDRIRTRTAPRGQLDVIADDLNRAADSLERERARERERGQQ